MEYFLVRYDSRVVIYNRRGFIRLATGYLTLLRADHEFKTLKLIDNFSHLFAVKLYHRLYRLENEFGNGRKLTFERLSV